MAKATVYKKIGKKKAAPKSRKSGAATEGQIWVLGDILHDINKRLLSLELHIGAVNTNIQTLSRNPARDLLLELYDTVRNTAMESYGKDWEPLPDSVMARAREYLFGEQAPVETVRVESGDGDEDEGFVPGTDSF